MSTSFKTLFSDKIIFLGMVFSCFFYLVTIVIVAVTYRSLPPYLPLFNKLAWGYARLGNTYEIAIPIMLPILLTSINLFLEKYIYERVPLLARLLAFVTFLLSLFTLVFIVKLVLIIL